MPQNLLTTVRQTINDNANVRFWLWQIGFWVCTSVIGFFTLILWYGEASIDRMGHVTMQAIIGVCCSFALHKGLRGLQKFVISLRIIIGFLLVLVSAFVWTMLHMQVFIWLTGFADVWDEFGGWYFSGIFIFLCWTGLYHGIRYYELLQLEHDTLIKAQAMSQEEHLKRVSAQSEARDAKLKMLRYQLNPHFLCNTLNAINSLIEIGESQKAQKMSVQLSEFLRYSLENDPDAKTTLNDEIEASNLYLEIEKTRFAERLQVFIDIPEQAQLALVPSLLLQPIIENSMKHAIAKHEEGGSIIIIASVKADKLILVLKDTGSSNSPIIENKLVNSFEERANSVAKGIGIDNIEQRLNALYNDQYEISTHFDNNRGFNTTIIIPLEFESKD